MLYIVNPVNCCPYKILML